jgi:hypothetical protein
MPSLQLNKLIGALRFGSKNIKLPSNFDLSPADRDAYVAHLQPSQRVAVPQLVPQWYFPITPGSS